jgi:ubiquitin-conjugating enzyme E2 J2
MHPLKFAGRVRREMVAFWADPPTVAPRVCLRDSGLDRVLFLVAGPDGSPYAGGEYVVEMRLPSDYPFSPPTMRMLTPSGRFEPGAKICTSFSSFHPEAWTPMYTFSTLIVSLVSFFLDEDFVGVASIRSSVEERRRLAAESAEYNQKHGYMRIFSEFEGTGSKN